MDELAKARKVLTETFEMIERQIEDTKTRLARKEKHLRWYHFTRRFKAVALKNKLYELFKSREQIQLLVQVTTILS